MKCQTWNVTVPNAIQISNDKQETNNKEFKAKTYKKATPSTNLTILYVTKLNFAIEIANKNWLVQSASGNTRAAWGDVTQIYH